MMKKVLIITCAMFLAASTKTSAFKSATHEYVTKQAIQALKESESGIGQYLNKAAEERLVHFSKQPDIDENYGAYRCHFFSLITGKNFAGGTDSALAKFTSHYYKALAFAKENNQDSALEELGRAIHFLEDLSTPVHSNNLSVSDAGKNLLSHVAFETKCVERQEETKIRFEERAKAFYDANNVNRIGYDVAAITNRNFNDLQNNKLTAEQGVDASIQLAQRSVAGVIYKFYSILAK